MTKIETKDELVLKMQAKAEKYFDAIGNTRGKEKRREAVRRAIWMVIKKDYSMSRAAIGVARTCSVNASTIETELHDILPAGLRNNVKKRNQVKFFANLKKVNC